VSKAEIMANSGGTEDTRFAENLFSVVKSIVLREVQCWAYC